MKYKYIITGLLGISVILPAGCLPLIFTGVSSGVGVAYIMGDLEILVNQNPVKIKNASEEALKDLKIFLVSSAMCQVFVFASALNDLENFQSLMVAIHHNLKYLDV